MRHDRFIRANAVRTRLHEDQGFTLIELLMVILIIGILASIALPTFTDQRQKAENAEAKSAVRSAVTQIETCFADRVSTTGYTGCNLAGSGITEGTGRGQVAIQYTNATEYSLFSVAPSGCQFYIRKVADEIFKFTFSGPCPATPAGSYGGYPTW